VARHRAAASATLGEIGGGALLGPGSADVGVSREDQRRRRLLTLAAVLGLPTAYLWWRILDGRPFDVFAFPDVDWLLVTPVLFFVMLAVLLVGSYTLSGRSPHELYRPEQLSERLSDVVGIDVVKDEVVRSLNLFLAHRTFHAATGGAVRRGLLFEGPPGTGKTLTAKAVAAEAGVPFLFASATSFQSSYYGATARKIRSYFVALRRAAEREGGAIGFIDEFDAIAGTRRGMEFAGLAGTVLAAAPAPAGAISPGAGPVLCCSAGASGPGTEQGAASAPGLARSAFGTSDLAGPVVNELLVQLQSFDRPAGWRRLAGRLVDVVNLYLPEARRLRKPSLTPPNILLIASTNRADGLDPALLRPGRFDRTLTFDNPDRAGRRALVDHFLARKAHAAELDGPEHRDALAALTSGWSPARLEHVLDEALVHAIRRGAAAMSWRDVQDARLVEEVGLGQPVGYTPHEERLIATHEAGHCAVAWLVAPSRRLEVLTIVKRRSALGLLAHGDRDEVWTRSRSELLTLIQIAMGGQCAEELFFGDVSTGPAGDLLYATSVAAEMVGSAGMAGTLVSYRAVHGGALTDSNLVGRVLGDPAGHAAVERLLQEQKALVAGLLRDHRHLVAALRDALLERHELVGSEITDVLEQAARAAGAEAPVVDLREDGAAAGSGDTLAR